MLCKDNLLGSENKGVARLGLGRVDLWLPCLSEQGLGVKELIVILVANGSSRYHDAPAHHIEQHRMGLT